MKFTCTQENISQALHYVSRIARKHATLPILENILIRANKTSVDIMGTDLEIGVFHSFRAKVEEVGEITVPAKIISGFISHIPPENPLSFELKEKELYIESGKYKATIVGLGAEDYPIIPKPKDEGEKEYWEVSCVQFRQKFTQAMTCVTPNDVRVEFSGVYTRFLKDSIILVSTDGFRLLEVLCPYEKNTQEHQEEQNVIIPLKTLSEILRCLPAASQDTIRIQKEEGQIFFFIGENTMIVSQLIKGNFPDYSQIIPKTHHTVVDLNTKDCIRVIKLAGVFGSNTISEVIVRIDAKKRIAQFESKSGLSGKNTSVLEPLFLEGVDQEIIFNPKYINDALSLLSEESFRWIFVNESSPAILGEIGEESRIREGFQYILMPIKK